MRKVRTYDCEDCGKRVTRDRATTSAMVCLECGIKRSINLALQMKARSGPYYERWLAATGRGSTTETKSGGA